MIRPPERLPDRDAAIDAMLPHVPFDGWTRRALARGLADIGEPVDDADLLFPGGVTDMIETFCDLADRRMEQAAIEAGVAELRLSQRVRSVIALRLAANRGDKEAVRRAVAVLALPGRTRAAAACTARTVDAIWHASGDTSADFSWYTKRAILTSVYVATLLFWLRDTSEEDADTLVFLDRRLAGVAKIGKFRRRTESALQRFLPGRLRTA
jgi:ubiquinone biosynthesis protein COQ9